MPMSLSSISPEIVWALIGIVLVFVEFFFPGLVIAFFGVGALLTALLVWIFHPPLAVQLIFFMISSIVFLVALRKYVKRTFLGKTAGKGDDSRNFNIDVGKIIPVVEFIQPGEVGGKVKHQGALWSARASEPIAPGESVKIIGSDGITLIVEKVEKKPD